MRYNSDLKKRTRGLRKKGFSLNQIFEKTNVPKTTIRSWISDIKLTEKQKQVLINRTQLALQKGRIKAQKIQTKKRLRKEKHLFLSGKKEVGVLTKRDSFVAGIALYWAEGFKNRHEHRLGFCNSDPDMISFYIFWLEKCLSVQKKQIFARLTLNKSYKNKTSEIQQYWADLIGIPLTQFTKPFYQNTKWKKQYSSNNYHGVLRIHVKDSLDYLLKMKGWIEGLKSDKISSGQRSSGAEQSFHKRRVVGSNPTVGTQAEKILEE